MKKKKRENLPIKDSSHEVDKKNALNKDEIIQKLKGTTLMVYFALLNKNSVGVRELQQIMGLSSPSVAKYHLDKLTDLSLAENRNGIYFLVRKAELPVLTSWVLIGQHLLPRVLFFAVFFTSLLIIYLTVFFSFWGVDSFFAILLGASICVYLWFEVIQQLRNKPI